MSIDVTLANVLRSDGDFEELLSIAGLDPSQDLRGCDFSNVDFGRLSAQKIDLSHCNLFNADLRGVQGRLILDGAQYAGAKFLPGQITSISQQRLELRARFDLIRRAIITAHRFQVQYNVSEQINASFDWNVPIVLFYRSPTERERLQAEIRQELGRIIMQRVDTWPVVGKGATRARFIEVRANGSARRSLPKNRDSADFSFFKSLINSESEAIVDVSMQTHGRQRYTDYTSYGNPLHSQSFSRFSLLGTNSMSIQISRESFRQFFQQQVKDSLSSVFFNDTSLFSEDLSKMLRRGHMRCCYVFLLNQDLIVDPVRQSKQSDIWPKFVYIKPGVMLNHADIALFVESFKQFEKAGLYLSEKTLQDTVRFYGRPAGELKNMLIEKLRGILTDKKYNSKEFVVV